MKSFVHVGMQRQFVIGDRLVKTVKTEMSIRDFLGWFLANNWWK